MPTVLDVFNQDMFGVVSLTQSINKLPLQPTRIGQLGLFKEEGVPTTSVMIQYSGGRLVLVPAAARGTMPTVYTEKGGKARILKIPHLPINAAVYAEDVQGVRDMDTDDSTMAMVKLVNRKMEGMKNSLDATKEFHRAGAIAGVVLDADGTSVLYDLYDEFDIVQPSFDFAMDDIAFDISSMITDIVEDVETALGQRVYTGIHALVGATFFSKLIKLTQVREQFKNDNDVVDPMFFRKQAGVSSFEFGGIVWERYSAKIGAVSFIDPLHARFFPTGAGDLFKTYYAPAPFEETVNTIGKPYYAKQERIKWDLGQELHAQSNPLMVCDTPDVLIRGVYAPDEEPTTEEP